MIAKRTTAAFATLLALGAWLAPAPSHAAATIVIVNADAAGEGFNDPTPAAPVGGNPGTTVGEQRLIAFQHAASIWGATLNSVATINVLSSFDPLTCTATGAVLGSAGAINVVRDYPGAGFPGTWYGEALANAQFGGDTLPTQNEIRARFNSNLGQTGCLTGVPFYLGLDNNHGPAIDLVAVVLHEIGHGLNFQTFTNGTTGAYLGGFPSIFDHFMLDQTANKLWSQMTNAERAASAVNTRRLSWTGSNVSAAVPGVLQQGTPELEVSAPLSVAGTYLVGAAAFGPQLSAAPVAGELMPVVDNSAAGPGCNPFSATNALAVNGKVALMDRGVCGFTVKVKNAQNAGAIAVIIGDNVAGSPPPGLGGADPTIVIPSVRITLADANALRVALRTRSRTRSGVMVSLQVDPLVYAGADPLGRVLMYTPNPFQGGSSVSHWDQSPFPNLLMEPAINGDLTHSVVSPFDLTYAAFKDIGWP